MLGWTKKKKKGKKGMAELRQEEEGRDGDGWLVLRNNG
jgi:hypothetical protein